MTVPVREELMATVTDLGRRLAQQRQNLVQSRKDQVRALSRALPKPSDLLAISEQKLDDLCDRLPRALSLVASTKESQLNRVAGGLTAGRLLQMVEFRGRELMAKGTRLLPAAKRSLQRQEDKLVSVARMLGSLSYERVLDRGFSVVKIALVILSAVLVDYRTVMWLSCILLTVNQALLSQVARIARPERQPQQSKRNPSRKRTADRATCFSFRVKPSFRPSSGRKTCHEQIMDPFWFSFLLILFECCTCSERRCHSRRNDVGHRFGRYKNMAG